MRKSLILLTILAGCVTEPTPETVDGGAYTDGRVDAPIDAQTDAPTDAPVDGLIRLPEENACIHAGVACVAGWCPVEYPGVDGGMACRCDRCGDAGT